MLGQVTSNHRDTADVPAHIAAQKFRVVLIKPSKYDDDGYVIRFWRGVLPSNTLNVLHGLTDDVRERRFFGDLPIEVTTFDETAEKVPVKKILRWGREAGTKLLVCMVGVQTNQFPRALDMARIFRAAGITVIMGGFHTSGTINMLGEQEPDIQELVRESICVVSGEVEGKWEMILSDFLHGRLQPIYSYAQDLQSLVDIGAAPLPKTSPKTMEHFAHPAWGTADTSRGCPFACTFCTIINVQGRKMRERSPESIAAMMRRNYLASGITFYFFTDDNFARKKLWRETFEEIIKLREEGIKITFMMQVDLARKPKDFVRLAGKAGCTQVFIGMESVNPENLRAEGKQQNHVDEYRAIIKEWHDAGVVVHAGYIIGLPWDSKEQVPRDIQFLINEVGPDQASFFMLTPLPGSHDHREMRNRGEWMDPDFNKRDSFHATIEHPRMSAEEWTDAYEDAWKTFYSKENMIRVLSLWKDHPRNYWNLMSIFFWYKNAALIEKQHPMVAGFFRFKERKDAAPGIRRRFSAGSYVAARRGNLAADSHLDQVPQGDGRGLAPDAQKERNRGALGGPAARVANGRCRGAQDRRAAENLRQRQRIAVGTGQHPAATAGRTRVKNYFQPWRSQSSLEAMGRITGPHPGTADVGNRNGPALAR